MSCTFEYKPKYIRTPLSVQVKKYREEVERSGLEFRPFGLETYGAWGASARNLRDSVCDPALHPLFEVDSNPWCNPDPKRTFTLAIAFAIQRGNAHMIQRAAFRRARNRRRGLYSSRLRA